jgi:hypothetical protein
MLQHIVMVLVQQNLLLESKPLVDWRKATIVHENAMYVLSRNQDPVFLAGKQALIEYTVVQGKKDIPGCWTTQPLAQVYATKRDMLNALKLRMRRRAEEDAAAGMTNTTKSQFTDSLQKPFQDNPHPPKELLLTEIADNLTSFYSRQTA